jgi:hypothetical protein
MHSGWTPTQAYIGAICVLAVEGRETCLSESGLPKPRNEGIRTRSYLASQLLGRYYSRDIRCRSTEF